MLVDTGSAVTIVKENVWEEAGCNSLESPVRKLITANGQEMELAGQAHGCVVDLQRNVVLIAVPLACKSNADENRVCHVTVADTVQVPASCELHISSRVATNPREVLSGDVLFEPRKDFMESHGLAVAHAVMQTRNDLIVVQVLNPHRMPVVLRKGEKIGCLKPLQDVCSIELIDEKGQKNSQRRQALEDAIDQLVSAAKNISDSDKRKLRDLLSQFGDVISTGDRDLGKTSMVFHTIDTGDSVPVRQAARRLPYSQRNEVREILEDMLGREIIEPIYLDDITVFGKSVEEHLDQLREVLTSLQNAGLKIKPSKCHLMQTRVRYLGHIVSSKGIEIDPEKVRCVSDWPTPTDQRSLKQFMGLASYYKRFVQGFAQVAAPLNALTEKTKTWEWTAECNGAFLELKKRLVSAPILVMPCFNHKFILDTDASGEGLGAVLSQSVDGQERVVAYASKTLSKTEHRYCATRLIIVPYNGYTVLRSRKGKLRGGLNAIVNESSCAVLTQDTSAGFIPVWTQEEIKNFQREDDNLLQFISLQTLWAQRDYLLLQDEVLYRQWEDVPGGGAHKKLQLVLPASLVPQVLAGLHDSPVGGHLGAKKTLDKGRNFENAVVKGICNLLGIKKTRTTPYHPQSDGMIERFNRTLLSMLSIAVEHNEHGWDLQLPLLMFAYRTSTHETTGATPFELIYGREAQLPDDLMFHIPATVDMSTSPGEYLSHLKTRLEAAVRAHANKQQMRQGENYNRTVKGMSRKMHKPWKGPFKVKTVLVVHNNRLKPFIARESTDEGEMNQEISDRETTEQQQDNLTPRPEMTEEEEDWELPLQPNAPAEPEVHHQKPPVNLELPPELQQNIQPPGIPPAEELRRSGRIRRQPSRYGDPVSLPDCFECEETL
eukprot:Em0013g60a